MNSIRIALVPFLVAAVAAVAVASPASASPRAESDIVGTAIAAGDFTTLTKLLKSAGLVATLRQKGPYTVFAPTDAAFAKVPKATLNALMTDRAKLKAVLLYHVAKGKVTAAQVIKLKSVKTLEGASLTIRVSGGKVYVGGAQVTKPDVMASNGVIHVINKVLIPPAM
jgi:uncharacterized surface protein with fasciclin (FAS1) repeats